MTEITEKVERDNDPSHLFAKALIPDECIDAANRASRKFAPGFPGWQLYSRIVRGDSLFDRQLAAWAIGVARQYCRARKINGQAVVAPRGRRNNWIAQAGIDALHLVIYGFYPASSLERARTFAVDDEVYTRIRNVVAALMKVGFNHYAAEVNYQLAKVRRENARIEVEKILTRLPEV